MARSVLLILVLLPAVTMANTQSKPPLDGPLVTVDQVIAMTKAGVSDAAILALIDRDRPVFVLASTHLVMLRKERVSEVVIIQMLMTPYTHYFRGPNPCSSGPVLTAPPPPPGSSSRGIFFTRPTRGIFFPPPPAAGCR